MDGHLLHGFSSQFCITTLLTPAIEETSPYSKGRVPWREDGKREKKRLKIALISWFSAWELPNPIGNYSVETRKALLPTMGPPAFLIRILSTAASQLSMHILKRDSWHIPLKFYVPWAKALPWKPLPSGRCSSAKDCGLWKQVPMATFLFKAWRILNTCANTYYYPAGYTGGINKVQYLFN